MAMLAERKRKQKWSLNPRGKHWSDDVNKFGQKMLEKMGWSAGKGLGRHENGMTEHVKVNYKNDARGMGFKDNGEQWTKHENNFTSLLESLGGSGGNNSDTTIQKPDRSLEEKSRSSRARVHYHKFTRGKDLSLKSEKDLANIFGRKTLEKPVEPVKEPTPEPETSENKQFGVVTVAAGSMTDYFKSKFGKITNAFTNGNKNTQDDDGSESESKIGTRAGFGFGSSSQPTNQLTNFVSSSSNNEQNGASKTDNLDTDAIEVVREEPDSGKEQKSEKKRKRKREEDEDEAQLEIKSKKLKKKKKKLAFDNAGLDVNVDEEVCYDNPCLEDFNVATNAITDPEPATSSSNAFINLGFNPVDDESGTKKKKKVKFASPEADDGTKKNNENITEEGTPKKSKKKKKNDDEEIGIDNPACEVLNLDDTIETEETVKPKKSKKKNKTKDESVNNESCEVISVEETPEDTSNEGETPKKSKKNKKGQNETDIKEDEANAPPKKAKKRTKMVENGIDNLACVVNIVEEGVASINSAIDNYQNELENEINERKAHKKLSRTPNKKVNRKFDDRKSPKKMVTAGQRKAHMKSSRTPNKKVNRMSDDRKSLKKMVTAGQLKLKFSGANLNTIPGYGVQI